MPRAPAGPCGTLRPRPVPARRAGYAGPQHGAPGWPAAVRLPLTFDPTMINVILALVPLAFATGSLVWLMTSGAKAQARSDAWAAQWVRDNT